ncbi:hypothetical protein HJC23_002081 [Cyclotella cryptica]|uniref:Cyclin N-terminal domain-containing protein n=1 Tax=Cyclotella cryptica TaxID=29204 RepID=A0ABD3P724_9STRA|eukprot:CCRYP_017099-RA/>CCRYP_017099-RA protein AED:0.05 eAED:-0.03 QI:0/-1/0/1/-1/1/1/0/596
MIEAHRFSTPNAWTARTSVLWSSYIFMIATIFVSGSESNAINHSRDRKSCSCDDLSISSVLWACGWECICVGCARCYDGCLNKRDMNSDFFWKRGTMTFGSRNLHNLRSFPRGGDAGVNDSNVEELHASTDRISESQRRQMNSPSLLPLIDAETVSLALRLTCETNRRLYHGTSSAFHPTSTASKSKASSAATPAASSRQSLNQPKHGSFESQSPPYYQQQQLIQHPSVNVRMPHQYSSAPNIVGSIAKPIQTVSESERVEERLKQEFTIFHASDPLVNEPRNDEEEAKQNERRGILRWGPDLKQYLDTLLSSIGLQDDHATDGDASSTTVSTHNSKRKKSTSPLEDERQLILSLTVLYLDHATSIETNHHVDPSTGQPFYPSCPYVVPRTVHRLVLTAMAIATKSIRGDVDASTALREAANSLLGSKSKDKVMEISELELQQMEQWMVNSLGGGGPAHYPHSYYQNSWQIPPDEIGTFLQKWGETFYPQRLKAHDERNRSRLERLERFWRDQATSVFGGNHAYRGNSGYGGGADHGHGNNVVGWDGQSAGYGSIGHPPDYHPMMHPGGQQVDYVYNLQQHHYYEQVSHPTNERQQ